MEENHVDIDGEKEDIEMASNVSVLDSEEEIDSSDDEAQEKELTNRKFQLQERIQKDKSDYYAYVELIEVLKFLGQLDELRKTREAFSDEYPLTPEIWLSWIEDEKKIATSTEEKEKVKHLFERALKDYLSVEVWLEYAQFSIGLMSDGDHFENVRCILERALTVCGYHVSKGALLWEAYREFENAVLMSLKESDDEDSKIKIENQKRNIAGIFRRQLSIPLLDMEKTYQELRMWLEEEQSNSKLLDMNTLENNYKKALEKLSKILLFEDSLSCCESDANLPFYRSYLEYEKNPTDGGNDPFRVRCLYERAIIDNPLNTYLWYDYIQYVSEFIKVPEDVMAVCYRAIRNCPSESKFWRQYMLILEDYNKPKNDLTDLLNKALQTVFPSSSDYSSIWLCYVYYLKRQLNIIPKEDTDKLQNAIEEIRKVLNMALENLTNYFGSNYKPQCELLLWWARFEAETTKNLESFRKLWTDIMNLGYNKSSPYWLKYINMEWQYGDAKHMRRLCSRALATVSDSPKEIADIWLEFESHTGSLDSFRQCQKQCDERMRKYAEEKKKSKSRVDDKKKIDQTDKKKKSENDSKSNEKYQKISGKFTNLTPESKIIPKGVKPNKSPVKQSQKDSVKSENVGTPVEHDPSKDNRTVFVSNLDYTVTEEDVKKVLESAGSITEFRLVKDYKGRSKGYGYIVFSSSKEVPKALKLDRTPLNQRPMFISECDPNKQSRKTGLRFSLNMEKNKLFVKGLPVTLDKEGVEKIFSPYGIIKDVRLVTYRNGHSKGLAYVEFEDEVSAAHALLKTDGMIIDDKPIIVAISDPPKRKNTLDANQSISSTSLGGGTSEKNDLGLRGRGRTQLSFVPRALQVDSRCETKKSSSCENKNDKMDVSENASDNTFKKPMSNADFRNLFKK